VTRPPVAPMRSRRVPATAEPNAWSRLLEGRRASGATLLDLTESNPTRVGLAGGGLAAPVDPGAATYAPDPRGLAAARAAVAGYYADRGIRVEPEHIVLTSSTSESYAHLFRLLADPGETLLVPEPSYPLFGPLAALEGVRLAPYRLTWRHGWRLDLDSLEAAADEGARAIITVEPNHPTGSCLAPTERAAVEELCERRGMAIVSDEVFGDFAWPAVAAERVPEASEAARPTGSDATTRARAARQVPSPPVAPDAGRAPASPRPIAPLPSFVAPSRVPSFVLSGISKVCGLPQLKLSWIVAAGPARPRDEALAGLEWIADLFLSVGTPVQLALPRLLADRHVFQARVCERLATNLARLRAATAAADGPAWLEGQGGWNAVLRLPAGRGGEAVALELLQRDVVVHPGHFYDFEDDDVLVVSLLVEPRDFAAGLERIAQLASS